MTHTIAIPTLENRGLDSAIGPHFGRSPSFVLVTVESGKIGACCSVSNPNVADHQPGHTPLLLREHGVQVLLAHRMGSRAATALARLGIRCWHTAECDARSAVEAYLRGELEQLEGHGCHDATHAHEHGHCCGGSEHDCECGGARVRAGSGSPED